MHASNSHGVIFAHRPALARGAPGHCAGDRGLRGGGGASSTLVFDPGLKAAGFKNLIVKKDDGAFNLKPDLFFKEKLL